MRHWIALAAVVAIPAIGIASDEAASPKDAPPKDAKSAPAFELADTKGKTHTLAQYEGKIVVLEWTEPGCPYVIRHAKAGTMKAIAKDYAGKGVVFLGVCTSKNTDAAAMQKFMDEHGIDYPVLMDPTGVTGRAFGATNTPQMFVIRGGKILYEGAIDDDKRGKAEEPTNHVRKALDEILAGKAVSTPRTAPYGCTVKYPEADAS